MKDCYCYLGLHFILLDDSSQSYILKLRDKQGLPRLAALSVATKGPTLLGLFPSTSGPTFERHSPRVLHENALPY